MAGMGSAERRLWFAVSVAGATCIGGAALCTAFHWPQAGDVISYLVILSVLGQRRQQQQDFRSVSSKSRALLIVAAAVVCAALLVIELSVHHVRTIVETALLPPLLLTSGLFSMSLNARWARVAKR